MKRWEEHVSVHKPMKEVFAYVSDFARHGEWSGHGLQVTQIGDGEIGVGTKFATVAKQFGTQREQSTITDMDEPRRFAWDSVGAFGRIHHQFVLLDDSTGTELSKSVEIVEPKLLARLMGWKLNSDVPKALQADLKKIKKTLEAL